MKYESQFTSKLLCKKPSVTQKSVMPVMPNMRRLRKINDDRAHQQKVHAEEAASKAAFFRHGRVAIGEGPRSCSSGDAGACPGTASRYHCRRATHGYSYDYGSI